MTFIVAPSRKPAFWAEVDRLNRAEKKAAKPDVHSEPAKPAKVAPDVHKKAGKVHTKPAAKKKAKRK